MPDELTASYDAGRNCGNTLEEEPAAHQLVGEVRLAKASTGSWSERTISHTGTETRPRLLREAAVGILRNGRKPDAATPCV